ncbi:hypothetical protein BC828DRAFT_394210 [Blastocladiella britannica]|nr:hypothetical protein BC828DRAFT_394210 [Blastocladiella britannica]
MMATGSNGVLMFSSTHPAYASPHIAASVLLVTAIADLDSSLATLAAHAPALMALMVPCSVESCYEPDPMRLLRATLDWSDPATEMSPGGTPIHSAFLALVSETAANPLHLATVSINLRGHHASALSLGHEHIADLIDSILPNGPDLEQPLSISEIALVWPRLESILDRLLSLHSSTDPIPPYPRVWSRWWSALWADSTVRRRVGKHELVLVGPKPGLSFPPLSTGSAEGASSDLMSDLQRVELAFGPIPQLQLAMALVATELQDLGLALDHLQLFCNLAVGELAILSQVLPITDQPLMGTDRPVVSRQARLGYLDAVVYMRFCLFEAAAQKLTESASDARDGKDIACLATISEVEPLLLALINQPSRTEDIVCSPMLANALYLARLAGSSKGATTALAALSGDALVGIFPCTAAARTLETERSYWQQNRDLICSKHTASPDPNPATPRWRLLEASRAVRQGNFLAACTLLTLLRRTLAAETFLTSPSNSSLCSVELHLALASQDPWPALDAATKILEHAKKTTSELTGVLLLNVVLALGVLRSASIPLLGGIDDQWIMEHVCSPAFELSADDGPTAASVLGVLVAFALPETHETLEWMRAHAEEVSVEVGDKYWVDRIRSACPDSDSTLHDWGE